MKTLMVMAGGTGGHIFPGIAVAEALRERGWRVVWLGHPQGMEARLLAGRPYEMAWLRFGGLRGKGLLRKLQLPFTLLRACHAAFAALRQHRPDVVLGMGGYISFPGGLMAALLRRPLVIHEQNSIAGLANRVLARFAQQVLSGFPAVLPRAQWVGNPVRAEIAAVPAPAQRFADRAGPLKLLVVGGSLGAAALNTTVPAALALLDEDRRPQVLHQAGEAQLEDLRARYAAAGVDAEVRTFIADMAAAYAEADVVICRAGALTVAELAAVGVASVLVPFPHAVDDHQRSNAAFLADQQAAWLLDQRELEPQALARLLASLNRGQLLAMAERARGLARPQAAAEVAACCAALAAGNES